MRDDAAVKCFHEFHAEGGWLRAARVFLFRQNISILNNWKIFGPVMPTPYYALTMARYNLWQNTSLMTASDSLSPLDRQAERGAFFGSIEKTFFHVFWADRVWMSRFSSLSAPEGGLQESVAFPAGWAAFRERRTALDQEILLWASQLDAGWFAVDGAGGQGPAARSRSELVIQMFNHQTHHRGQIHAMLTSAGARPDDTDIFRIPAAYRALPV